MARVLMSHDRRLAIELTREMKRSTIWCRMVNFSGDTVRIHTLHAREFDHEFCIEPNYAVPKVAKMFLNSHFEIAPNAFEALTKLLTTEELMQLDVKTATTRQLLDFYNERNKEKPIKKFADRKTAERRVAALLSNGEAATVAEPTTQDDAFVTETENEVMASRTRKTKPAKAKKQRPTKTKETRQTMSAAVSETWKNKRVATARSTKHKVSVGGVVYRSVLAAFEALKLDVGKHISFRKELKATGKKKFGDHMFTLVQAE